MASRRIFAFSHFCTIRSSQVGNASLFTANLLMDRPSDPTRNNRFHGAELSPRSKRVVLAFVAGEKGSG
jgi:hypothetical protein